MISGKVLVILFVIFVDVKRTHSASIAPRNDKNGDEEAAKIALETTGELIAEPELVEKIKSDLQLIRYLDKSLEKRIHTGKWKPGQVMVSQVSDEQLKEVEKSEFKPVKQILKNKEDTILIFAKPYHPEQLGRLLKLRFGFDSKPVLIERKDEDDRILYRDELSTYYWNSENGKDCEQGCLAQYAVSINDETLLNGNKNDENSNDEGAFGTNILYA